MGKPAFLSAMLSRSDSEYACCCATHDVAPRWPRQLEHARPTSAGSRPLRKWKRSANGSLQRITRDPRGSCPLEIIRAARAQRAQALRRVCVVDDRLNAARDRGDVEWVHDDGCLTRDLGE